ncbi:nitroreductase family protein [Blastococcus sp. SYSU D00813]
MSADPDDAERLLRALRGLRSTRSFSDEPVTAADLDRIIDAARWTGSARNRQPWRFVAVIDRVTREHLSVLGAYAAHLAAAPLVLVVLSADDGRTDTEFDVGRVVQAISLAAHALGLGSCPATLYPAANVDAAARLVRAPARWQPRHAVSIGRPAPTTPRGTYAIPTGRLPVDRLLTRLP